MIKPHLFVYSLNDSNFRGRLDFGSPHPRSSLNFEIQTRVSRQASYLKFHGVPQEIYTFNQLGATDITSEIREINNVISNVERLLAQPIVLLDGKIQLKYLFFQQSKKKSFILSEVSVLSVICRGIKKTPKSDLETLKKLKKVN